MENLIEVIKQYEKSTGKKLLDWDEDELFSFLKKYGNSDNMEKLKYLYADIQAKAAMASASLDVYRGLVKPLSLDYVSITTLMDAVKTMSEKSSTNRDYYIFALFILFNSGVEPDNVCEFTLNDFDSLVYNPLKQYRYVLERVANLKDMEYHQSRISLKGMDEAIIKKPLLPKKDDNHFFVQYCNRTVRRQLRQFGIKNYSNQTMILSYRLNKFIYLAMKQGLDIKNDILLDGRYNEIDDRYKELAIEAGFINFASLKTRYKGSIYYLASDLKKWKND